jgi:hypothetical protein
VVEGLVRDRDEWLVQGRERVGGAGVQIKASQVVLATGTLATTRLVLKSLPQDPGPIRLLSNPMAAFLLLLPSCLGAPRRTGFGLAQLSFVLDSVQDSGGPVFGNLFSTCGLPVSEFLRYVPLARRNALGALRAVLSATIVGNCFLSGELSQHSVRLDPQGRLLVAGGSAPTLAAATDLVRRALRRHFLRLGAVMLPGSFVRGAEGADIHYAGTLPMKTAPRAHECWPDGSVAGLPGVFVADGASLPLLSSKAHTLTIMANADRIGRGIAGAA